VTAYSYIRENRGQYGVKQMVALFGVSRPAHYKWARHGTCGRREASDAKLLELIRAIADRRKRRCGSPRVRLELSRKHGVNAGGKRVACLMRENGLRARRPRTADSPHGMAVHGNLLDRDFRAQKPGGKWVSSITYLRVHGGGGFGDGGRDPTPRQGLVFHSDRGSQYCSALFRDALLRCCPTVRQSMSRRGCCWDNARGVFLRYAKEGAGHARRPPHCEA